MTNHEAIETLKANYPDACFEQLREAVDTAIFALQRSTHKALDTISRQDAIDALQEKVFHDLSDEFYGAMQVLDELPSAEPKQRYTEEELSVFAHGISLSLLSKRSAQHWRYDEDTATEIEFLERLYEKVGADMRGEQDG